jgi:ribonuclease-3
MSDASREEQLSSLEKRVGRRFDDRALLTQALTHRSWVHENPGAPLRDYERLEFLGDAVLGFFVAERVFRSDPAALEGELTRRKQGVVSTPALAAAARRLDLGPCLLLGRGEEASGGRERDALLADAYEALLGAVFLDGGIRAARTFVRRSLDGHDAGGGRDPKTELQERWQARSRVTPRYRIVATEGPAHAREFTVEVLADDVVLATGQGRNRKAAEQAAAARALLALEDDKPRA